MGVDHGGFDVFVSEEFLHGADVVVGLQEVGGEGVPKGVATDGLGDSGEPGGGANGFLQAAFVGVVAVELGLILRLSCTAGRWGCCGAGVGGEVFGGENILPGPFAGGVGVFLGKRIGQVDGAVSVFEVLLVDLLDAGEVFAQGWEEAIGEHGEAVFFAFAFANDDAALFEIQVFDAQAQAFDDAQAGAVEDFCHELVGAGEGVDDALDFAFGEDGGEAFGLLGTNADGIFERFTQDFTVEEEDGAKGLVLGGGSDFAFDGQVGDKGFDFGLAHFAGVAFFVEEDEAARPFDVGFFGTKGIMLGAQGVAHLVEQFAVLGRLGGIGCCHGGCGHCIIVKVFLIYLLKLVCCGYYNEFLPYKPPHRGFIRNLFRIEVFRTEKTQFKT